MKKNKMFVLKKKSIVTMALISVLVIAGYLNYFAVPKGGYEAVETSGKAEESDKIPEVENYGEVKLVSADNPSSAEDTKLSAEKERSRAIDIYREIAKDKNADVKTAGEAAEKAENAARAILFEGNCESALLTKGFSSPLVTVTEENVYVSVQKDNLSPEDISAIGELIVSETGYPFGKIKINTR